MKTIDNIAALGEAFVARVKAIPQVQSVLLVGDGEDVRIWTVLDAPPFDRKVRELVYRAESDVLRLTIRALADFRLINLAEFDEGDRQYVLPPPSKVL